MQFFFGDHTLDEDRRELRCGADPIAVEPQVFDLLIYLVQNRDHVVSKDDLIEAVWGGRVVSDSTLTSRINAARKAIGDSGRSRNSSARSHARVFASSATCDCSRRVSSHRPSSPRLQADIGDSLRAALPLPDRPAIAVLPFVNMSGRSGAGIFLRRHQRRHHNRAVEIALVLRDRTQLIVHIQGQGRPFRNRSAKNSASVTYVGEAACERKASACASPRSSTMSQLAAISGLNVTTAILPTSFAVQDEITEAIVGAIEPQLYAAENFRAQRKAPDSMDAWDLVMRGLSHYWRLTRQDNMVAQALLEKGDSYRSELWSGAWRACRPATHSALTWVGRTWRLRCLLAERAAMAAIRADSEDPWAHHALGSVHLFTRRFDDSLAEFELALQLNPNFSLAQAYYGLTLSYCGRWQDADLAARPRVATQST